MRKDARRTSFEICSRERERRRADVIHCTRWDTLNRRYVFRPTIRCSVGQLISPFLSQARMPPSQPHMFRPRPHWIRCISPTRAPSSVPYPFAAFYLPYSIVIPALSIKHNIFNSIYILPALQLGKNLSNSNNHDGGAMLLSPTRPSQIHPHPVFGFSQTLPPPASSSFPSLLGVGSSSDTSCKATRIISSSAGSIHFAEIGRRVLECIWRYGR
jgi:hypothetical protein